MIYIVIARGLDHANKSQDDAAQANVSHRHCPT
jgi:hypothetical protein